MNDKDTKTLLMELEIQDKISKELDDTKVYLDFCIVPHNPYSSVIANSDIKLDLITISETHNEKFLFHSITANNKLECLILMLDYIKSDYKKKLQHYKIDWRKSGTNDIIISWFWGKDFMDVVNKFFYSKNRSEILIYEIKLMPES